MRQVISFNIMVIVLTFCSTSAASDTAFTYQGELKQNGNPANGSFNIDFELWDAVSHGNQIGTADEHNGVPVVGGKFTVQLDFGATAFDNSARWLQIIVNGTELTPRQPVARAPYAIQTRGIFVDDNENVGFGTSTPVWELEVANPTAADAVEIGVTADDAGGALAAYSSTFPITNLADRVSLLTNAFTATGLDLRADGPTSDIRLYTGGFDVSHERMRITDTGLVGIGKTDPDFELDVDGAINTEDGIRFPQINGYSSIFPFGNTLVVSNAAAGGIEFYTDETPGDFSKRLTISENGNVAIGTITPNFLLHVDGTAGKPGGGPWEVASDVRLKKNIEPIVDSLDTLMRLRGVTFEYIDPAAIQELPGQRIGMIAQEVEKVVPDWVAVRADGYKTVTPRGFEALTVEALRELRAEKNAQISTLRNQNETVRDQLISLQQDNSELRAQIQELAQLIQRLSTQVETVK